ncbi:MAG: MBL fold metallo-hydrolase [Bacillus sp. (in: Bacteria)]|nr:MBL fold metallo-hydrolase [Bacillus sp. (in: firmicutes)]MCM1427572.1 MBL fold metallo-hydrolase [Eubacterium sp.]
MKKKAPKHYKRFLRGRKKGRRFRYAAAAVIIALLYVVLTDNVEMPVISQQTALTFNQASNMEVHFIDVGQGDCTLVKCGDSAMLIDTGDDTQGTTVQNYLQKQGITKLDYLILTHPDADHIGAAPVIITKFQIDTVFMSNYEKDNKTYRKLIQALDEKGLSYLTPKVGDSYALGDAQFIILAPNETYDSPNNASIAFLLQNGDNKFLFSGDAEEEAESDILNNGLSVSADVYQVGHHGSRTSSSQAFLDAVNPAWAVISCAEGNDYGHPHAQTLNTLRSMGIKVFRTDEQGSIVAYSDGKKITWNCTPSETWKAGEAAGK